MVEDGRWVAEIAREWKKAREKLMDSLSDPEKVLLQKGIPSYIAKAVSRKFTLLDRKGLLALVKKKPEVGSFILEYLEKDVL